MNVFEQHGIDHLSPSSCNRFVASPALFVMEKLLKRAGTTGAGAHRGTSVEAAVAHGLMNQTAPLAECVNIAIEKFKTLTSLSVDPRVEKEFENLAGYVEVGLKSLRPYGIPTSMQGKIEMTFDNLSVPILGFYDFEFAGSNLLIDLKTSATLSSKISASHARQVALYAAARKVDARIAYVTPRKSAVYGLESVDEHLKALVNIGVAIQKFLSQSADPMELASMVVPDIDSFYFNDPLTRAAAYDIWGI